MEALERNRLESKIQEAGNESSRLTASLEDARREAAGLREEYAGLQEKYKATTSELQTGAEKTRSLEQKLQQKTAEVATLTKEKSNLKSELEDLIVNCQRATHEQHKLEYDKANADELIGNLQSSKQVLQRAANEQMLSLNMQLNESKEECLRQIANNKKLAEAYANIQELYQTEQRKNQTLLSTLQNKRQFLKRK